MIIKKELEKLDKDLLINIYNKYLTLDGFTYFTNYNDFDYNMIRILIRTAITNKKYTGELTVERIEEEIREYYEKVL